MAVMKVLVCNAGSSSLKLSLFEAEAEELLADGGIDWSTKPARLRLRRARQAEVRSEVPIDQPAEAIARIVEPLQAQGGVQAVGHRVVHGGDRYTAAVRITSEVKRAIDELSELAPLHNPPSLECIEAF